MDRWTVKVITVLDLMSMRIQKTIEGFINNMQQV